VLEYKKRLDLSEYVEQHDFIFDEVLSEACSNKDVYQRTTRELVEYVCKEGKTYTMMGGKSQPGLYMSAAQDIFRMRDQGERDGKQAERDGTQVYASFFEIYGGKIFDLLNSRHACVKREDGRQNVLIRGLTEHVISS
ncbi:P-loop containing nucleoside triphosphate hydrolase protein, partial [Baffinella frigidus]